MWALAGARKILAHAQSKIVSARWAICSKSDSEAPDIRARLVACELNTYNTHDRYASTPPLEAKRMLLSELAMRRTLDDGRPLAISFVDPPTLFRRSSVLWPLQASANNTHTHAHAFSHKQIKLHSKHASTYDFHETVQTTL